MKILAITACTAGIAHTYIAKEKLEQAAGGAPLKSYGLRCPGCCERWRFPLQLDTGY